MRLILWDFVYFDFFFCLFFGARVVLVLLAVTYQAQAKSHLAFFGFLVYGRCSGMIFYRFQFFCATTYAICTAVDWFELFIFSRFLVNWTKCSDYEFLARFFEIWIFLIKKVKKIIFYIEKSNDSLKFDY